MAESQDSKLGTALSSDSKERWAKHAISKLTKGYKLIISKTRRSANFHKPGSGFETCPHKTAMKLVHAGYLNEIGEHDLGIIYELKPEYVAKPHGKKKSKKPPKPVKAAPVAANEAVTNLDEDDTLDDEDLDIGDLEVDDLDDEDLDDDDPDTEDLDAAVEEV